MAGVHSAAAISWGRIMDIYDTHELISNHAKKDDAFNDYRIEG